MQPTSPSQSNLDTGSMPDLPGLYYDSEKNRYFKGTRPREPPPPPTPPKRTNLPRLLHSVALGEPVAPARIHSTLISAARPQLVNSITSPSRLPPATNAAEASPETIAWRSSANSVTVTAFPNYEIGSYGSDPLVCASSYGTNVAILTRHSIFWSQVFNGRRARLVHPISLMSTVVLAKSLLVVAGRSALMIRLRDDDEEPLAVQYIFCGNVQICDVLGSTIAVGARNGNVTVFDGTRRKAKFLPSGPRKSIAALKITDDLVWACTMRGGTNLSSWDMRDTTRPAIVCRGQNNLCKKVGLDVAGNMVIAGGDDGKVRIWDIRGGGVLNEFDMDGIVKRVKLIGWNGGSGSTGVWLDTEDALYARVVAT